MSERETVEIDGRKLSLSNLDKILFPDIGLRKRDLIRYYMEISPYLLPHLQDRPLTLWPYPDGITSPGYVEKEAPSSRPEWVLTWEHWSESKGEGIRWVICNDRATLAWLANLACIEIHAWFSRKDLPERPDFVVFDLDPSPPAGMDSVVQVARLVKVLLDQLKLKSFLKTSGATGLHVYLPIERKYSYDQVRLFAQRIAILIAETVPDLITEEWRLEKRSGKVRIDYTQNTISKTLASVYSIRPRPGAPVSCPLNWEELREDLDPAQFNFQTIFGRLKERGDLFRDTLKRRQKLDAAFRDLGLDFASQ